MNLLAVLKHYWRDSAFHKEARSFLVDVVKLGRMSLDKDVASLLKPLMFLQKGIKAISSPKSVFDRKLRSFYRGHGN